MPSTARLILRNPGIRISAISIFVFGISGAATTPYLSIIGIRELGISNGIYSLLLFVSSCVNVVASVLVGILADRLGHFRLPMVAVSLFGIFGYGAIYLRPSQAIFVGVVLTLLPIFGSLQSLIFANVRAASRDLTAWDLIAVNSAVRAMISASWVLVPGMVGFALATQSSMLPAFLIASLASLVCLLLFVFLLPKTEAPIPSSTDVRIVSSLRLLTEPGLLLRALAISLVSAMLHMNGLVLPLVITGPAHGTNADVGIVVGLVAFLEIPFILLWGMGERRFGLVQALSAGTMFYCAYLFLLGFATRPEHVYLVSVIGALGAGAIISLPITYLQNLIADRAGLGSSLIAVNMFVSAGLNALIFAIGTSVASYSVSAMLGAAAGLAGIWLLLMLEKPRKSTRSGSHG